MAHRPRTETHTDATLAALFEEYRVLYDLALFRLSSLDRRVPTASAVLTVFLGLVPILSTPADLIVLLVVPASVVWLVRTTLNHARSFEDCLRRIEAIERIVNDRLGETVLCFQSTHPSRSTTVGGRTSVETATAVIGVAYLQVLSSVILLLASDPLPLLISAYAVYVLLIATAVAMSVASWWRYRSPV